VSHKSTDAIWFCTFVENHHEREIGPNLLTIIKGITGRPYGGTLQANCISSGATYEIRAGVKWVETSSQVPLWHEAGKESLSLWGALR
jgi:hypothetical protein